MALAFFEAKGIKIPLNKLIKDTRSDNILAHFGNIIPLTDYQDLQYILRIILELELQFNK